MFVWFPKTLNAVVIPRCPKITQCTIVDHIPSLLFYWNVKHFLIAEALEKILPLTQMKYFRANNLWTLWRLWAKRKARTPESKHYRFTTRLRFESLDFAHLLNVSSKSSQFTCRLTMEDFLRDKNTSRDSKKSEFNILEEKENVKDKLWHFEWMKIFPSLAVTLERDRCWNRYCGRVCLGKWWKLKIESFCGTINYKSKMNFYYLSLWAEDDWVTNKKRQKLKVSLKTMLESWRTEIAQLWLFWDSKLNHRKQKTTTVVSW